jgi:hypothetical protein
LRKLSAEEWQWIARAALAGITVGPVSDQPPMFIPSNFVFSYGTQAGGWYTAARAALHGLYLADLITIDTRNRELHVLPLEAHGPLTRRDMLEEFTCDET